MVGENYLGRPGARPWHVKVAARLTQSQWRALGAFAAPRGSAPPPAFGMTTIAALLRMELIEDRDGVPVATALGYAVLGEGHGWGRRVAVSNAGSA